MNRRTLLGAAPAVAFGPKTNSSFLDQAGGPQRHCSVSDHPDADLIALCDRFLASEAEARRLGDAHTAIESRFGIHSREAKAAEAAWMDHEHDPDLIADIADATPQTMDGWRAKAKVVHAFYDPDPPNGSIVDNVLWSVIEGLAGAAT